ncbi:MAG: GntR family transcriptional regulator [Saezia sp.]
MDTISVSTKVKCSLHHDWFLLQTIIDMTKTLTLERLDHTQTKDRVASMLRQEILSGRIKDGDQLLQEQIAEKLGISRMPVREAFQALEQEGLLMRLPNRHIRVIGLNKNTLYENMQLVAAIETEVLLILLNQKKNLSILNASDEAHFHERLLNLLDNPYIGRIYKQMLKGYPQYIWEQFSDDTEGFANYRAKLKAIKNTDRPSIATCVQEYYRTLADILINHIERAAERAANL